MNTVYLDHAATTPLDPAVFEAMLPYLREHYGNPSSVHRLGRRARFVVEESRDRVAAVLGCEPGEIVFTSGGTEADNTAVKSILAHGGGLVTSAAEHEAVLRPAEHLEASDRPVTILEPQRHGAVTPSQVEEALTGDTALVSIMHVNNELGTVSPIRDIAEVCRSHGVRLALDILPATTKPTRGRKAA